MRETEQVTTAGIISGLLLLVGVGCGIAAIIVTLLNLPPQLLADGRVAIPLECYLLGAMGISLVASALTPTTPWSSTDAKPKRD